jgi:hypothetical protein
MRLEEFSLVCIIELRDVCLECRADCDGLCTFLARELAHAVEIRIVFKTMLVDIGDVHYGL